MFRDFTNKVLHELETNKIIIIGGESKLGKSEGFLQDNETRREINTGGLYSVLKEMGIDNFELIYLTYNSANQLTEFLKNPKEYLFLDEGLKIVETPQLAVLVANIAQETDAKIVMLGGGRLKAKTQIEKMKNAIQSAKNSKVTIKGLEFPPLILNEKQALELLKHQYKASYDEIQAKRRLLEMKKFGIPLLYPLVENIYIFSPIQDGQYNNMIGNHIEQYQPSTSSGSRFTRIFSRK